eukprot:12430057-Karenia_brevis.AAC.1
MAQSIKKTQVSMPPSPPDHRDLVVPVKDLLRKDFIVDRCVIEAAVAPSTCPYAQMPEYRDDIFVL